MDVSPVRRVPVPLRTVKGPAVYGGAKLRESGLQIRDTAQQTVAEWLDQWVASRALHVSPGTAAYYGYRIRLYLKPGELTLAALTSSDVSRAVATWTAGGTTVGEVRNSLTTLRAALATAVELGLIPVNVAKMVKKPRARPREARPMTADQAR